MYFNRLKSIVIACLLVSLMSCAAAPTHLIVSPQVNLSPSNQLSGKEVQLNVIDMRTSPHIIQILKKDDAATILSSEQRLEDIIQDVLATQWPGQGLALSPVAKNKVTVSIEKAIVSVNQKRVSYTTQSEIIIKVSINNNEQTLTNLFKNRAHNEGALNADIAALEREFNKHLSTVLEQLLISKDIKTFL